MKSVWGFVNDFLLISISSDCLFEHLLLEFDSIFINQYQQWSVKWVHIGERTEHRIRKHYWKLKQTLPTRIHRTF